MTDSKQCAFPTTENSHVGSGLTKREYFAATIMAGIMADIYRKVKEYDPSANEAVKAADALIKALNEIPNPQQ